MKFSTGWRERSRVFGHRELLARALVVTALFGTSAGAQKIAKSQQREQTSFGSDLAPGEVSMKKPLEISQGALLVLRNTKKVRICIEAGHMTPEQVPASWFMGSEIHLNGPNEVDFIVQPRDLPKKPSANSCLYAAHAGPFWVLRSTGRRYELLLETNADGLFVLNSRTKGHRDIKEVTGFIGTTVSVTFHFDGERYRPSERREKNNDAGS